MNPTTSEPAASYRLEILAPRTEAAIIAMTLILCRRNFEYRDDHHVTTEVKITTMWIGPVNTAEAVKELEANYREKHVSPGGILLTKNAFFHLFQFPA